MFLAVTLFGGASYYEHNYTRKDCKVTKVNDSYATIVDQCGFAWKYDSNGLQVGDIVDLKMEDNFTNSYVFDDVIKQVVKK